MGCVVLAASCEDFCAKDATTFHLLLRTRHMPPLLSLLSWSVELRCSGLRGLGQKALIFRRAQGLWEFTSDETPYSFSST